MCGYKDQIPDREGFIFDQNKFTLINTHDLSKEFALANWYQPESEMQTDGRPPVEVPGVGGIGNFFIFHLRDKEGRVFKEWSKFGMTLPLYPGKDIMYYNATIEKLEEYQQGLMGEKKLSKFGRIAITDFTHQPCVVFVNRFFEADKKYNTGYYKIERKDGGYIPLAGFFGTANYNDKNTYPAHTLVTRDPYPSIEKIGHHRSPVILPYDRIMDWLDVEASFQEKLDIISQEDDSEYIFKQVDKKSVTKRTPEARNPVKDAIRFEGTLYHAESVDKDD